MSKKFEGILLCTDLDDTLLTTGTKLLTDENRRAIEYFMAEGGNFTFATGRVPAGARLLLDLITPNAPMICFNGGAIYDFENDKILWGVSLDEDAVKVLEYVDEKFPHIGIEVCTDDNLYFCKENSIAAMHRMHENLPHTVGDYKKISFPWKKAIFLCEDGAVKALADDLFSSDFADKYDFVQSSPNYFELLPKGTSKGSALLVLADLLHIDRNRTIGVGDNHNDIEMIMLAGVGIAVKNAVPEALKAADTITVDNNSHALSAIIKSLDEGKIKI